MYHCEAIIVWDDLLCVLQVDGVQVDCLFGNMREVSDLSKEFLEELELYSGEDTKQARVGGVFISYAPRMKDVFGTYCHNHDTASALYEKVCVKYLWEWLVLLLCADWSLAVSGHAHRS